jgi:two-component system response regulator HydG
MHELRSRLGLVLQNDVTVFLHGESGTGKELVARAVHQGSSRASHPFVAVNCGAIPKELQESYFFGHEQGAFTGAHRRHRGFFEEAEGGTLFLDEVGELTLDAQVKLLRALQEREIRRVGGATDLAVDVRVLSASNRDLPALIRAGEFREDLYYRLVVYPVRVPALRDRRSDIPLLAGHFLGHYADQLGLTVPEIARETLECLLDHPWPGNVRELQNTVQFALLASQGETIRPSHLPESLPRTPETAPEGATGEAVGLLDPASGEVRSFEDLEREIFIRVLALAGNNVTEASRLLGIGRATFYRRLSAWADRDADGERRAS